MVKFLYILLLIPLTGISQYQLNRRTSFIPKTAWQYWAVIFDGLDRMNRGANLSNIGDCKTGTFSCWYKMGTGSTDTAVNMLLDCSVNTKLSINRNSSKYFEIRAKNAAGTSILVWAASSGRNGKDSNKWTHVVCSWDLSVSNFWAYVDGVSDTTAPTITDDTIDYTTEDWAVGARTDGANAFNGSLCELWFSTNYFTTNIVSSFRSSGKPANLNGGVVSGITPQIYLHDYLWTQNLGNGGALTVTGSLADDTSIP